MEIKKKYNLLLIQSNKNSGIEYYRQYLPHEWIANFTNIDVTKVASVQKDGKEYPQFEAVPDDELKRFDAVQFIRHIDLGVKTKGYIYRCHQAGCKVIFDIDDYFYLPSNHKLYERWQRMNIGDRIKEAIQHSDLVTTTTETLAEQIYPLNKNVEVLYNCLDLRDKVWHPQNIPKPRMAFGYIGGLYHTKDVALMTQSMAELWDDEKFLNEGQLVLGGFNLSGEQFVLYENLLTHRYSRLKKSYPEYIKYLFMGKEAGEHIGYDMPYKRVWGEDINTYGWAYNNIDVALVPLENNLFTSCKSQLKIIEAGIMGKAVIASNVTPYKQDIKHKENGLLVSNGNRMGWYEAIKYYLCNPNAAKEHGAKLQEFIKSKYNLGSVSQKRYDAYKKIMG